MAERNHLLIDGYNVIHQWPDFARRLNRDAAGTCDQFVETVRVIHDIDHWSVTVVFDGRGKTVDIQHPGEVATFAVLYAPSDLSADGLIEQIVRNAAAPSRFTVVSRDNLIAESIRASGGFALRPDDLWEWVNRCEQRSRQTIRQHQRSVRREWKESSPWDALDDLR